MNHPRHPHPLKLKRDEGNPFECSGCKELGFGQRYESQKNCNFVLHDVCFKARPTDRPINHPFMGSNRRFKFLWTAPVGPNGHLCHACEREVRGFMYRVRSSNHWLYLHPCCMNLQRTMYDPYLKKKLILKDKVPSNTNCVKCKRRDLNGTLRGWSYVSSCGNYCYHVYCGKKLILDIWETGYFNVASSSPSSSRGKGLVRAETTSTYMSALSDSSTTSTTSSLALPPRPSWRPRIPSPIHERVIKLGRICLCLAISKLFAPQNPAPLFKALNDEVQKIL